MDSIPPGFERRMFLARNDDERRIIQQQLDRVMESRKKPKPELPPVSTEPDTKNPNDISVRVQKGRTILTIQGETIELTPAETKTLVDKLMEVVAPK